MSDNKSTQSPNNDSPPVKESPAVNDSPPVNDSLRLQRSKAFARTIKESNFYENMDSNNKQALNVWAEQGEKAAIAHMFTDQETGRQLSYGEMRMRYG